MPERKNAGKNRLFKRMLMPLLLGLALVLTGALVVQTGVPISFFLNSPFWLFILAYGIFLTAAIWISTLVHELGHLVFGLIFGYHFLSFRIGRWILMKQDGKLVIKTAALPGTLGQCLMGPGKNRSKAAAAFYNAGGGLFTIALAVLSGWLMVINRSNGWLHLFFFTLLWINEVLALTNLIPSSSAGFSNDGKNLSDSIHSSAFRTDFFDGLQITELLQKGLHYKEMPEKLFISSRKQDFFKQAAIISRLMDEHEFEQAGLRAQKLIQTLPEKSLYTDLVQLDLACCLLKQGKEQDAACLFESRRVKSLMKAKIPFPQVLRSRYFWEKYVCQQAKKAAGTLNRLSSMAKSYAYEAEVDSELEIVKALEKQIESDWKERKE